MSDKQPISSHFAVISSTDSLPYASGVRKKPWLTPYDGWFEDDSDDEDEDGVCELDDDLTPEELIRLADEGEVGAMDFDDFVRLLDEEIGQARAEWELRRVAYLSGVKPG